MPTVERFEAANSIPIMRFWQEFGSAACNPANNASRTAISGDDEKNVGCHG